MHDPSGLSTSSSFLSPPPSTQHQQLPQVSYTSLSNSNAIWNNKDPYTKTIMSLPYKKDTIDTDMEMKPLDLSIRTPRQENNTTTNSSRDSSNNNINNSSWYRNSYTTNFSSSSLPLSSSLSSLSSLSSSSSLPPSSNSRSQRLSPYTIPTGSSSSRHLSSPCLASSRSPLSRSISPYYPYHRQTPSPYYNYLSGSCTPPENSSSLQVLSSTNRILNALSSTPTSMLRSSYEDCSSQDNVIGESNRIKEDVTGMAAMPNRMTTSDDQKDIEAETDEPTYIDMDSSTTVKSMSSTSCYRTPYTGSSSIYTSSSNVIPQPSSPHHQHHNFSHPSHLPPSYQQQGSSLLHSSPTSLPSSSSSLPSSPSSQSSQYHSHNQLLKQEATSAAVVNGDNCNPMGFSLSKPSSSPSSLPPQSMPSTMTTHSLHYLNSSHSNMTRDEDHYSYCNTDKSIIATPNSTGQSLKDQVSTSTVVINQGLNTARSDSNENIHREHNRHYQHQHRYRQNHQQYQHHQQQCEESQQQQQNPDSSSSPTTLDSPTSSVAPSPWRTIKSTTTERFGSPTSTTSRGSVVPSSQSPQLSPDSNLSRSSSLSPSNKENFRGISGSDVGSADGVSTAARTATRRSFFQIDKSIAEANGSSALFSDQLHNDESGRCSLLDFWISKILMDEAPQTRCNNADIRQTIDGNRRIRLRLVDLIELQVEQSLKA